MGFKYYTLKEVIKKGLDFAGGLNYKGIKFDDVVVDETIWSQICPSCAKKYKTKLKGLIRPEGSGICGVRGCKNGTEDDDIDTYYVDFYEMPEQDDEKL